MIKLYKPKIYTVRPGRKLSYEQLLRYKLVGVL